MDRKSNQLVVVGSYNVDMTLLTDQLPKPGETVLGNTAVYGHGGKGANQAVAAARAGGQVAFIGKVGDDEYGAQAIRDLAKEGIDIQGLRPVTGMNTGLAAITVDSMGENTIVVVSGANQALQPADLLEEENQIRSADTCLLQLESPIPTVLKAAELAFAHGVPVILNPAPAQPLDTEILKLVSVITPNRVEAEMLTGTVIRSRADLPRAADCFHALGVETVLITLGAEGVFCSQGGQQAHYPAVKVEACDTVGAGDVFNGVLAAYYNGPDCLEDVLSLAISAAALAVTRIGAQAAIPGLEAIEQFQYDHQLAERVS